MTLTVKPVTDDSTLADHVRLFSADPETNRCWCMWWIIPVKAYHEAGPEGNRRSFTELAHTTQTPIGLLAYDGDEPVGWCAVGPRSRYARGIKTPTYKGRDPAEDEDVWLVPCLYVSPARRNQGVTTALLSAAIDLARQHGAAAVEGFPLRSGKRQSKDTQVGFDSTFAAQGFDVISEPSANRVLMRLELGG